MIKKPFTIQFPENPVSGFSWNIATSNGLQITRDRFIPEDEEKTGSGGYRVWDIQVTTQQSKDNRYIPEG
ncbi:protease inhibitor I42 family protein [Methanosarcina horonobensis]|uniref:protease inhibitor I42 family protein n=1 Tax=Methanosarcina horonobensis TaxID=418008 RepID=UPI000B131323|nr:protease inhibitor I42 family protein [Methanosarcina horonobensis]